MSHANDGARAGESERARKRRRNSRFKQHARTNQGTRLQHEHANEGASAGGGCLKLQGARALWKGLNGDGICARGITLNVEKATKESSQLSSSTIIILIMI